MHRVPIGEYTASDPLDSIWKIGVEKYDDTLIIQSIPVYISVPSDLPISANSRKFRRKRQINRIIYYFFLERNKKKARNLNSIENMASVGSEAQPTNAPFRD